MNNVRITGNGRSFCSPYVGVGYANIGESRLTVDIDTGIIGKVLLECREYTPKVVYGWHLIQNQNCYKLSMLTLCIGLPIFMFRRETYRHFLYYLEQELGYKTTLNLCVQ